MQSRETAKAQLLDSLAAIDPLNDNDPDLPHILSNLTAVYFSERALDDADAIAQRMLLVCRQMGDEGTAGCAAANNNLGVIWGYQRKSDVETLFGEALDSWTAGDSATFPHRLIALNNLAAYQIRTQDFELARGTTADAWSLAQQLEKPTAGGGIAANNAAIAAQHEGRFGEAEELYRKTTEIWQETLGANHEWVALSLLNLSSLSRERRLHADAEHLYQSGMAIRRSATGGSFEIEPGVRIIVDYPLNADDVLLNSPDYVSIVRALKRDTLDQVTEYVTSLGPWYQNFQVKPGLFTNPMNDDRGEGEWRAIEGFLPKDLSGKTVLDIGCQSGFIALQMKRRGARRVVGLDADPLALAQARFVSRWAAQNIELRLVESYGDEGLGTFDYVVCMDVLDWPEAIAALCKDTLFFRPAFNAATMQNLDVKAGLETAGFREVVETSNPEILMGRR